ncbi:hypothetical protein [Pannonibacter phragmitetus]|uniref:hypothetical protein n=1 Tax=Pannonibacter phragmitetus TaxID=121719 RepID=UPI003D2F37C3
MVAPVVSSMGRALSQLKEDSIVALDPGKIDPSPSATVLPPMRKRQKLWRS